MDMTLPTWWVIQLVCRLSFNFSAISEPFHHLDCLHNIENRTIFGSNYVVNDSNFRHQDEMHRLYYKCLFTQDETKIKDQTANCRTTDPPLSLFANDSESFDFEQEFPKRVSLDMANLTTYTPTIFSTSPTFSTVWLTLPKLPYFNETLYRNVRLNCNELQQNNTHISCKLEANENNSFWRYELKILFIIIVMTAIAAGGIGNILVCLAVCLDRRLQNVTNYFLLSLAIADLLVSLFVMPLGAIQGFFGYWPLGIVWCNVYVSCDVLACSCSIMHMCSISWGRYIGIRNPLKTRHAYATKRIVAIKIAVVWALSITVSATVTILGLYDSRNIMPEPNVCVINNSTFFVLGSVVAFYIPMLIMVVTYVLTVQLLRKKARFLQQKPGNEQEPQTFRRLGGKFRKPPTSVEPSIPLSSTESTKIAHQRSLSAPHKWKTKITSRPFNKNSVTTDSSQPSLIGTISKSGTTSTNEVQGVPDTENTKMLNKNNTESPMGRNSRIRTLRLPLNVTSTNLNLRFLPSRNKRQNVATVTNAVRTEQKASKVLGLVFFSFVLCWAPFFLLNIVFAICPRPHCRIPPHVVDVALWLGYASSIINPIIYTIFNRTFRAAFVRLLQCKCQRLSRPPRYRSVNENRNSAALAQTPSSAAAGAATVPLSLSLQGTPLITPSSASSFLTNVRTPIIQNQSESFDLAESSSTTTK